MSEQPRTTSLFLRRPVTTRDPGDIRRDWDEVCDRARKDGWPKEAKEPLDRLRAEHDAAMAERGAVDLRGFPLTPYSFEVHVSATLRLPRPSVKCCAPYCFHVIPDDAKFCGLGHQQVRLVAGGDDDVER